MRSGFSLVEVLISIAVLALGLLGLIASMAFGMRASAHAQRVTEANNYARQIIEHIRMRNLAGNPPSGLVDGSLSNRTALNALPLSSFPASDFTRNIQIASAGTDLYRISVTVYWKASGYGEVERRLELVALHGN